MTPQVCVARFCLRVEAESDVRVASSGNTALTGANLLFEMLCVLPKVKYL